ncbi:hypothetical protein ACFWZ2_41085 [Streptomyces sp. NPDC059002]|uniref:hypothetical protein n=1 Tax=Streptomyces sp. NPDC059002 TaxID=3346690 RepID=UPI0036C3F201
MSLRKITARTVAVTLLATGGIAAGTGTALADEASASGASGAAGLAAVETNGVSTGDLQVRDGCELIVICGTVYNRTDRTITVTMDWADPSGHARRLGAGKNTEGWGDVDGIYVPTNRKMKVFIQSTFDNRWVTWKHGWHKIRSDEVASVHKVYKP